MTYADEYIIDHGITTEEKYPYTGRDGKCKVDQGEYKFSSYKEIDSGDCD